MIDAEGGRPSEAGEDSPARQSPIVLERYVPAFITFIANKWSRSSSSFYRRHFGIGMVEWRLMVLLAIEPWITAARADAVIGMDKAAVSRSVRELEKRGLVALRPNEVDPRRREMALTAEGRRLHDRVAVVALERERRLLACLSADEREVLIGMLDRIHRNLPKVNAPLAVAPDERGAAASGAGSAGLRPPGGRRGP